MIMRAFQLFVLLVLFGVGGAFAQTETATRVDFAAWEKIAARAEASVKSDAVSDAAFETLRQELVVWRGLFGVTKDSNAERIATLKQQISALGPIPEDPASESAEIIARRAELSEQMNEIETPVVRSTEAYSQAGGLINEIDQVLRDRQTNALFERSKLPINPFLWATAIGELGQSLWSIGSDTQQTLTSDTATAKTNQNWPQIAMLLVVFLLLVLGGRNWAIRLADRIYAMTFRGSRTLGFVVSLAQVLLPYLGFLALVKAVDVAGVIGVHGQVLVDVFPTAALCVLVSLWLGKRIFTSSDGHAIFEVSAEQSRKGRIAIAVFGSVFAIRVLIAAIVDADKFSVDIANTLYLPLTLISAFCLWRLSKILRVHVRLNSEEGEQQRPLNRILSVLGRAGGIIALVSPILAVLGYSNAAEAIVYPSLLTLGLLAFISLVQRLVDDIYALITGKSGRAEQGLLPVIIHFVIVIISLPVLALIWGARVDSLTELWTSFQNGFALGDTRISPTIFLTLIVVFLVGYFITRLIQGTLRMSVLPKTKIDSGGQNAIISGLGYLGIFASVIFAVSSAGIDLSSLAIVAGALSVGIGFGLQNIVSNFVSGIILLIERPVAEGDWIEVGQYMGIVKSISVRSSRIETFDKTEVIVPNSDLISGTVVNWTRNSLMGRVTVPVGVAYGTDTRKVEKLLIEIAADHPMVLVDPPIRVFLQNFGADSVNFDLKALIRDVYYVAIVKSDLNHEIIKRFAEEDIAIPFPQRDLWLRNPEDLAAALSNQKTGPKE